MIPKKIHYCWFGGKPLTEMAEKCIASWKKFAPDFEIIRWDETNFDISAWQYTKEAYEAKKFAFVADVARLYALVNYGGIYMDTDVELIKPIDSLLEYEAISGFETPSNIPTGLMGCVAGFSLFGKLLKDYSSERFIMDDGSFNMTTNVVRITEACSQLGLILNNQKQTIAGFTLLPQDYLCPQRQGIIEVTENSLCIHWFVGSWHSEQEQLGDNAYRVYVNKLVKFLPRRLARHLARFISDIKYHGILRAFINVDSIKRHWNSFKDRWRNN